MAIGLGLGGAGTLTPRGRIHTFPAGFTTIIRDQTFTTVQTLDGSGNNNTLYYNCVFNVSADDAITIRDVTNIRIQDCVFNNIGATPIRILPTTAASTILIVGNRINGCGRNGILTNEDVTGLRIMWNWIEGAGTTYATEPGALHGLYMQCPGVYIEGNYVLNGVDPEGNGISVRSDATIYRNMVDTTGRSGISYFPDHPHGVPSQVTFEENIVVNSNTSSTSGRTDYNLLGLSGSPASNLAQHYDIINNIATKSSNQVTVSADYAANGITDITISGTTVKTDAEARADIAARWANRPSSFTIV